MFSINKKTSVQLHDVEVVVIGSILSLITHPCLYEIEIRTCYICVICIKNLRREVIRKG